MAVEGLLVVVRKDLPCTTQYAATDCAAQDVLGGELGAHSVLARNPEVCGKFSEQCMCLLLTKLPALMPHQAGILAPHPYHQEGQY